LCSQAGRNFCMGERPVCSDPLAAGRDTAEEGQGYRSVASRKSDNANNVGLLASGDARGGSYSVLVGAASRRSSIVASGRMTQQPRS
jgi:hypothetical protein